jgi:hypothetical protein
MRLIGSSLRMGSPLQQATKCDMQTLVAANAEMLMRLRAERAESFAVRLREMFVDMRLLWPALGATAAVAICVAVAGAVLQASTEERPGSVAAILGRLSDPGSERNPMRPDGGNTIPRAADDRAPLEGIANEDSMFLLNTVVGRDGRIATADLVQTDRPGGNNRTAADAQHLQAVLDAAMQLRFAPAQTPIGQAIAVNVPLMIVVTTAEKEKEKVVMGPRRTMDAVIASPPAPARPASEDAPPPVDRRSAIPRQLTTA